MRSEGWKSWGDAQRTAGSSLVRSPPVGPDLVAHKGSVALTQHTRLAHIRPFPVMVATPPASGGFSYAQAAKGRLPQTLSQTSSSKVVSGTTTPATGVVSETSAKSNWADDVEATLPTKAADPPSPAPVPVKRPQSKDTEVDRTAHKAEETKPRSAPSDLMTPDLAVSPSVSTNNADDALSAHKGSSSETTWDTKSQVSEPAWIAERKERQGSAPNSEATVTDGRKKPDWTESVELTKPVVLQEAPLPTVNPWQKRAQEAKSRGVTTSLKPAPVPHRAPLSYRENDRPATDPRRRQGPTTAGAMHSTTAAPTGDDQGKSAPLLGKRITDTRVNGWQGPKPAAVTAQSDYPPPHLARAGHVAERKAPTAMTNGGASPTKDDTAWPTPESAKEIERKEVPEKDTDKDTEEKRDEDAASATKRKKQEWKVMPVVPTVIWETQAMNEQRERRPRIPGTGERGARGGSGPRGRGGYRGGAANGIATGDRMAARANPSSGAPDEVATGYQNRFAMDRDGSSVVDASAVGDNTSPSDTQLPRSFSAQTVGTVVHNETAPTSTSAPSSSSKPVGDGRFRSSKKSSPEKTGDEVLVKIVSRHGPTAGHADETRDMPRSTPRGGGSASRGYQSDGRKESRHHEHSRDPHVPRGGKRNGRGRGGSGQARDLANGHPGPAYNGGALSPEYTTGGFYLAGPLSPGPHAARGGQSMGFGHPGASRGSPWSSRGNIRSQSIPILEPYRGYQQMVYSATQPQFPVLPPYSPAMYEAHAYSLMPGVVVPPQPTDPNVTLGLIAAQLEYYFSMDNLLKDMFLRKHMDSQGFVFLDVVANFNRMKQLTDDRTLLKSMCPYVESIELRIGEDGKERLRCRANWDRFVLPMEQRFESAQSEGPKHLETMERTPFVPAAISGSFRAMTMPRTDNRSHDGQPAMNADIPHFTPGAGYAEGDNEGVNGDEGRGRWAKTVASNGAGFQEQHPVPSESAGDLEPDAFPDDQVSVLTVVTKVDPQRIPFHSASSRTFSNGSIDCRSIFNEMDKPDATTPGPASGEPRTNGDGAPMLSRHVSPDKTRSPDAGLSADMPIFWVKDQEVSTDNLPDGLGSEPYVQLRLKALRQREQASTGTCPYDLDVLYQFWCHFLLRNFNNGMYSEFTHYARADAADRSSPTGLQSLVKFYSQSLSSTQIIRDRVARDYVALATDEPRHLDGAAFKSLRSAWRNGALNLKNRKKLADVMPPSLKAALDKSES